MFSFIIHEPTCKLFVRVKVGWEQLLRSLKMVRVEVVVMESFTIPLSDNAFQVHLPRLACLLVGFLLKCCRVRSSSSGLTSRRWPPASLLFTSEMPVSRGRWCNPVKTRWSGKWYQKVLSSYTEMVVMLRRQWEKEKEIRNLFSFGKNG